MVKQERTGSAKFTAKPHGKVTLSSFLCLRERLLGDLACFFSTSLLVIAGGQEQLQHGCLPRDEMCSDQREQPCNCLFTPALIEEDVRLSKCPLCLLAVALLGCILRYARCRGRVSTEVILGHQVDQWDIKTLGQAFETSQ